MHCILCGKPGIRAVAWFGGLTLFECVACGQAFPVGPPARSDGGPAPPDWFELASDLWATDDGPQETWRDRPPLL